MSDSTLALYDTNGTTLLEFNDDYVGLESRVFWTAPATGTYFLEVQAFSPFSEVGTYDLAISLLGDFNGDGAYMCNDIDGLIATLAAGNNDLAFDMNGDFFVDLADRDAWLAAAGAFNIGRSYLLGDATLDGFVNALDFNVWNSNKFTSAAEWCSGDFNADGFVDGKDFLLWNLNKFQIGDSVTSPPITPFTINSLQPPIADISAERSLVSEHSVDPVLQSMAQTHLLQPLPHVTRLVETHANHDRSHGELRDRPSGWLMASTDDVFAELAVVGSMARL